VRATATAAAVRASATATVLGESVLRQTKKEGEGSDSRKKSVQQGGFHFSTLHAKAAGRAGRQTAPFFHSISNWNLIPSRKLSPCREGSITEKLLILYR